MKKNYSLVQTIFFIVSALLIVQCIILSMKQDLRQIIGTCVVVVGFIVLLVLLLLLKGEVNKIIYEYENEDDDLSIRLLEYDDYQSVRELLCETPLSNTEDEVKLLQEYDTITTDLVRHPYHYIVFIKDQAVLLFHVKTDKNKDEITFLNEEESIKEKVVGLINEAATRKKRDLRLIN